MAKVENLLSENITVKSKLDANIVKGQSYEGLPVATNVKSGTVMIDNITIKNNTKGQLYCTITSDNIAGDDSIIVEHIQNQDVHLSISQSESISNSSTHMNDLSKHLTSSEKDTIGKIDTHILDQNAHLSGFQVESISNSTAHINDSNKHLTTNERSAISKINTHILDQNIHIDQEKITNIELGINHINNSSIHLSINDRDNLNDVSSHIYNSDIHVTQIDKNKIGNIDTHIINSNIHLSESDRENINTTLSMSSTFPAHVSNNNVHFAPYEKEQLLQKISDSVNLENDLNQLGESINNLALTKLDNKNHEVNKMLTTDDAGNIAYKDLPSDSGGNTDTINGKKIFIQQSAPTPTQVGDVWISW